MTQSKFGQLDEVPLTSAWEHEAHEFTAWLSENLDRLLVAIGIPLELPELGPSRNIRLRCPCTQSAGQLGCSR